MALLYGRRRQGQAEISSCCPANSIPMPIDLVGPSVPSLSSAWGPTRMQPGKPPANPTLPVTSGPTSRRCSWRSGALARLVTGGLLLPDLTGDSGYPTFPSPALVVGWWYQASHTKAKTSWPSLSPLTSPSNPQLGLGCPAGVGGQYLAM